ncbi:MAG: DUF3574 domain-containing protein [Chloroflexi bacterium]|nr:DUF3574 domain-containing protein [Chloroflexota bacterium]
MRGLWIAVVMTVAMVLIAACVPLPADVPCAEGSERYDEYRLFFGRNIGNAEGVSDEDWRGFLADTVTPRFPDGLSVFDAAGQWRDSQGSVVRERSKMVLILAEPDSDALTRLDEIADEYKRRFSQESVLRVVDSACVAF